MAVKPTVFPQFAVDDLNNGTGGAPNVVEPSAGKKLTGWNEGERPPRETFNWLHRITNNWVEYFEEITANLSADVTLDFAEDPDSHSGLEFFMQGGAPIFGNERFLLGPSSVVLPDNDDSFVFYNPAALDTQSAIGSSFPATKNIIPLFIVTTLAGAITNVQDVRTWANRPSLNHSLLDVFETRTAGINFNGEFLDSPQISDFTIEHQAVAGIASTVIDYIAGQSVALALDAADITTLTINNWPLSGALGQLELTITQGATPRAITWPAAVVWPDGIAPNLATANGRFKVHLSTYDGGTTIDGTFTSSLS